MKKTMTIILILAFIFNISSLTSFADEKKETVEKDNILKAAGEKLPVKLDQKTVDTLVKLVKSKIEIPADYEEFYSEVNNLTCRLRWSNNDNYNSNGGSIEVNVNEKGIILNYNNYKYYRDYDYQKKLPKISKSQGLDIAKKFIFFISPDIISQINLSSGLENCSIENEGNYRFYFYRQNKDIPFYENSISILINGITGETIDYSRNWSEGLKFPEADKVMKIEDAREAYLKKIPLALKYSRTYGEDTDKTYLEYSPETQDIYCSIDSITGEKIKENPINNLYIESMYKAEAYWQENYGTSREINMNEQQLNDLKKKEKLISFETAEKLARSMNEVGIDNTYSLNRSSYTTFINTGEYFVKLDFIKAISKDDTEAKVSDDKLKVMMAAGEFGGNLSVIINAKTSELLSLNSYGNRGSNTGTTKFDKKSMEKNIDSFLKKFKEQKYKNSIISINSQQASDFAMKYGGAYSGDENTFVFIRKVNDISYEDNQLIITFDPTTGKINNYLEKWDEFGFDDKDKVIGIEKAKDALFKNNDLKLKYSTNQTSGKVHLVYALDNKKPICIDAKGGALINYYNDEVFKIPGSIKFNDIEKSPAKLQIQALLDAGILFEEENFRPKAAIVQKEWLYMISKVRNSYGLNSSGALKQKEMDGMYRIMIMDGIITEGEKNPDYKILREEAVKYLINGIGYKKFAEMEGIFNCTFADKNSINPKLIGHISIAKSLKIIGINSINFMPKKELTREDAAIIIYNYLRR